MKWISFADVLRGCAVGIDGFTIITKDGGNTWKTVSSGSRETLFSIAGDGELLWAVGARGSIVKSLDAGNTWKTVKATTHMAMSSVDLSEGNGWCVGSRATLLKIGIQ